MVVPSTKYLSPASSAMLELKRSFFFSLASRSNFFFVNLHKKLAGFKKIAFFHENGNVWKIFAKMFVKWAKLEKGIFPIVIEIQELLYWGLKFHSFCEFFRFSIRFTPYILSTQEKNKSNFFS